MKRMILAALVCIASVAGLHADDYYLYILGSDNAKTAYAAADIQKITFENGNVVVSTKAGQKASTPIAGITEMYFNIDTAEGISGAQANAAFTLNGHEVVIGTAGRVHIYQASGVLVKSAQAVSGTTLSLADLPAGIYIIQVAGKSLKFVKR